jgi:hypothetical protein
MSAHVLNPYLYERLKELYGEVRIASPGEACMGGHVTQAQGKRYVPSNMGEYYRVCCPFCSDRTFRLWVNHRWGVGPVQNINDDDFWWSAICFNDDWGCMNDPANFSELRNRVYQDIGRDRRRETRILRGEFVDMTLRTKTDPGVCIPIHEYPTHMAQPQYMMNRGYDLHRLGDHYGISVCVDVTEAAVVDPRLAMAMERIIVPIFMNGEQVGWQGRYPEDLDFKDKRNPPKYFFCPGTNRRVILYNFDRAKEYPFVVVTEGVTDVWTIGDCAIATFGKKITPQQCNLLHQNWKTVILALDADAIEESVGHLRSLEQSGVRTIRMEFPPKQDPASLGHDAFWDMAYWTCLQNNLDLESMMRACNGSSQP